MRLNGKPVPVSASGNWRARVHVNMGANSYEITASAPPNNVASRSVTLTREMTAGEKAAAAAAAARRKAAAAAAATQRAATARQNFINSAKTIPYNQLIKDPESFAGQRVAYHGQIFQIQESGGSGIMLLSVTDQGYGLWTDEIWVNYNQHVASAKDDTITVYGTVLGTKTYDTQIGGSRYVPEIDAKYIVEGGSSGASTAGAAPPSASSGSGPSPGTVTGTDSTGHNFGVNCSNNPSSPLPGCDDSPSYNADGSRQQP